MGGGNGGGEDAVRGRFGAGGIDELHVSSGEGGGGRWGKEEEREAPCGCRASKSMKRGSTVKG